MINIINNNQELNEDENFITNFTLTTHTQTTLAEYVFHNTHLTLFLGF